MIGFAIIKVITNNFNKVTLMSLRDTFLNILSPEAHEVQKVDNSVLRSSRDFLRNGNREKLYPTWADVKMSDSDMYRGYSYAVIQKRGNKVASLARENLMTWANPATVDEFQKKNEAVFHPYLTLIENSTDFTEKQFWKNISIYLDLAGRYYLGVLRNEVKPLNPNLPVITTDPTKFIMLNPYEIRRVVDKDGNCAGYIERKKDGRYREWALHQIIEMRELNPFDPDNSQWAMTDAAKDAVYTINQSSDYTRQSLNGNIDAPGIITTDVLLNDEDFANFRERVVQHTKGEPLFGNGTGAITWNSMQVDLDKAALLDINEINRTTLFAVSGTSKTSLGIEQSGTTRETAKVQSEQFVSDTAQPRLEDIVDFLNLDYKRHYPREFKKTGYFIEVKSAVGRDYETETKATAMRQAQIELAMSLMQAGYTRESAYQYATGDIEIGDLELEQGLDKPKGQDEEPADENSPVSPKKGPQSGSDSGDDSSIVSEDNSVQNADIEVVGDVPVVDLNELDPYAELKEGGHLDDKDGSASSDVNNANDSSDNGKEQTPTLNGGEGSGFFGHVGRKGKVGGSAPKITPLSDEQIDRLKRARKRIEALKNEEGSYAYEDMSGMLLWELRRIIGEKQFELIRENISGVVATANDEYEDDLARFKKFLESSEADTLVSWSKQLLTEGTEIYRADNSPNGASWTTNKRLAEWLSEKNNSELLTHKITKEDRFIATEFIEPFNYNNPQDEVLFYHHKTKNGVSPTCTCNSLKSDEVIAGLPKGDRQVAEKAYDEFLAEIRKVEKDAVISVANKVNTNVFSVWDLITPRKKNNLIKKLATVVNKYWKIVYPLFASAVMNERNQEFNTNEVFTFTNELQADVSDNADKIAKGHIETVLNDILEACNRTNTKILEDKASDLIVEAYDKSPKVQAYFDEKPTKEMAMKAIQNTDILDVNRKLYEKASKMALEGHNRQEIVKAIKNEYKDISDKRAELIAGNETIRAHGWSQYSADKQFLTNTGKLNQAYKVWHSARPENEQDKICVFCKHLIETSNANPIPFEEPFVKFGDTLEVVENDKVHSFTANFEEIQGATLHPNCLCWYELVFKNASGEFVKTLNFNPNHEPAGSPKGGQFAKSESRDKQEPTEGPRSSKEAFDDSDFDSFVEQKKIHISSEDLDYIKTSGDKRLVNALMSELEKAEDEGLKLSAVELKIVEKGWLDEDTLASCYKDGRIMTVELSKPEISDYDFSVEEGQRLGKDGKRWWTCESGDAGQMFRHELGHCLNHMGAVNKRYDDMDTVANRVVTNAKKEFIGMELSQRFNAKKTAEQTERLKALEENSGFKYMSEYGTTNKKEMIAEAYCNPSYSEFTQLIYKHLQKELEGKRK